MSTLSFLILFILVFSLFFLSLAKGLSIFKIFFKNQLFLKNYYYFFATLCVLQDLCQLCQSSVWGEVETNPLGGALKDW